MGYSRKPRRRNFKGIKFKGFEAEIRNIFGYYLEDIAMRDNIAMRTMMIRMRKATGLEIEASYFTYLKRKTFTSQLTVNTLSNFAYAAGGSFEEFCRYYINYKKANRELESYEDT